MQKKTFIFDWNGTLLADTVCAWRATNEVLKKAELPPVSLAKYREHYAVPIIRLYEGLGCPRQQIEKHQDFWIEDYTRRAATARLRRGARDLLHQLQAHGHETLILSNYSVDGIGQHTKRLGIHERFNAILANETVQTCMYQGKADKLKNYLAQTDAKQGIVFGDSEEEAEIARAHGLAVILIANGFCSTRRLRAAKPDHLVNSLEEVPGILREKGWLR